MPNPAIWSCKIGEVDRAKLPHGSDAPLRKAVQDCYRELTGEDDTYIFSGWGAKLDEAERAVLENRLPDPEVIRDELTAQLEILPVAWAEADTPRESHVPSPDLLDAAEQIAQDAVYDYETRPTESPVQRPVRDMHAEPETAHEIGANKWWAVTEHDPRPPTFAELRDDIARTLQADGPVELTWERAQKMASHLIERYKTPRPRSEFTTEAER